MLESSIFGLAICVPLLLVIFLATSGLVARLGFTKLTTYTLLVFGAAWVCGLSALGLVIFNGSVDISLIKTERFAIVGFLADRLSLVILLLVTTVSGVVHLYSLRAMQEERHFSRYFLLLSLVTVEVVLVVLANNLIMLTIFWVLKGFTLTFLLAHYSQRAASWQAAMTKLRWDLVGAISLVAASIVGGQIFGTLDIEAINRQVVQSPSTLSPNGLTLMTILLFVAAMVKSAQFPFHTWLPQSVEAPTPVSALMHAGLINAGGFLLVRLSPLFLTAPYTLGLVVIVGSFTAFYGTLVMLTRSDNKGKLVYSTMGQMGFMMLECGLGAFALATFHIVAHGLFKATLFLNSGNVIEKKLQHQRLAPPDHSDFARLSKFRLVVSSFVVAGLFFLLAFGFGWSLNSGTILLAFAWITLVFALPKLAQYPLWAVLAGIIGIIGLYLAGVQLIENFFQPAIAPLPSYDLSLILVVSGVLMLAGLTLLLWQSAPRPLWMRQFLARLYVRILFTGYDK